MKPKYPGASRCQRHGQSGQLEKQTLTGPAATLSHPMGEGLDALLTQDEVAARLKVTVRTVVRLQHDGVLPFIALGKAVRFFWPAVISHLTTHFTVVRSLRSATTPPATIHSTTAPAGNKGGRP